MRLLTHNLLTCNIELAPAGAAAAAGSGESADGEDGAAAAGEPVKMIESEFVADRIVRLLPKLDWAALRKTAAELGVAELPESMPARPQDDEAFLRSVHLLVMDIHVMEATLVCPHCARRYPIRRGVPNMLLREDEV